MRAFLVVLLLLMVASVALAAGAYWWCSCALPAVDVPALPQASVVPANSTNADGTVNWQARTLVDLAAAQKAIWNNTPVPLDDENPQYRHWAIAGYREAEARAAEVTDAAGYFYTLAAYVNGFHDPHFQFGLVGDPPAARWPGFIVARRGDGAEVVYRDAADIGAPPVGAVVTGCDGKPLKDLLDERIYPFRLNPKLAEDQRTAMTRLFTHRGNPFAPAPQRCGRCCCGWRPRPSPTACRRP